MINHGLSLLSDRLSGRDPVPVPVACCVSSVVLGIVSVRGTLEVGSRLYRPRSGF